MVTLLFETVNSGLNMGLNRGLNRGLNISGQWPVGWDLSSRSKTLWWRYVMLVSVRELFYGLPVSST